MLDQQVFQAELLKDETILWTGRPDPSIHTLPGVQTWIRRNGTGTITFGDPSGTERGITFYDIQDVQQVYELVNDIRGRLAYLKEY